MQMLVVAGKCKEEKLELIPAKVQVFQRRALVAIAAEQTELGRERVEGREERIEAELKEGLERKRINLTGCHSLSAE